MSTNLNITETEYGADEYSARYITKAELDATGQAEDMPPAKAGIVEIHIGEDVYADEWADTVEAAQKWVDDFDFEELERQLAEPDEPDYDPWDHRL